MKTPIKYDKVFQWISLILLIISGTLLALFAGVLLAEDYVEIPTSDFVVYFITFAYVSIPMFPLSLVLYIEITVYLKRLEKNHFIVPVKKKDYEGDLRFLPRTEVVENRYTKDSFYEAIIALTVYVIFVICDVSYQVKWLKFGVADAKAVFVMLMVFHLMFLIAAFCFYRQRDPQKYIDSVDIRDGRKVRTSLMEAVGLLIVLALMAAVSVVTAHSMTEYIYKSRNGRYDKNVSDFQEKATIRVASDDLYDGVWDTKITNTAEGENLSPHLYFDPVEGAEHYVIYMVDETDGNWVHWMAACVHENELFTGDNASVYANDPDFQYVGPYPPAGSGEHKYSIYVYALQGEPDCDLSLVSFDDKSFGGDILYYDFLNVTERGKPNRYGNVLAYGYISGVYSVR